MATSSTLAGKVSLTRHQRITLVVLMGASFMLALATGLTTTRQQVGLALGTPIMAAIVTAASSGHAGLLHAISAATIANGVAALVICALTALALPDVRIASAAPECATGPHVAS